MSKEKKLIIYHIILSFFFSKIFGHVTIKKAFFPGKKKSFYGIKCEFFYGDKLRPGCVKGWEWEASNLLKKEMSYV